MVFALTLLLLFTSCPSHYPGMPMITLGGKVTLEDGTPLAGVAITIVWPEIGQEVTVETNSVGLYRWKYAEMTGDWRVTLTPWHSDYDFLPPKYDLPKEHGDNVSLDFTAMPSSPDTVSVLVHRLQANSR